MAISNLETAVDGVLKFDDIEALDVLSGINGLSLTDQVSYATEMLARLRDYDFKDDLTRWDVTDTLKIIAACAASELQRRGDRDPLTGMLNRRKFNEDTVAENAGYAVIMADVDFFKRFNDEYGHDTGDHTLRNVAQIIGYVMTQNLREDVMTKYEGKGTAYRLGGEEFAAVIENIDQNKRVPQIEADRIALKIGQRLRIAIEEQATNMLYATLSSLGRNDLAEQIKADGTRVTVSIGVATAYHGEQKKAVLDRADQALYSAKRAGRNRVKLDRG